MEFIVEIVLQNLVTMSTFVRFLDSRNFTFFEVLMSSNTWHDHGEATWHHKGVTQGKSHVVHLK